MIFFAAALLASPSLAAFTPDPALVFDRGPRQLTAHCRAAVDAAKAELAKIAAVPDAQRTFDNTVAALDRAMFELSDDAAPDVFLEQVSTSAAVRDAANACDVEISQFDVDVYSREDLDKAVVAYAAKKEPLAGEDARLLDKTLLDFKRSGFGLPDATRKEVRDLRERIAKLEADFGKNIAEDSSFVLMSSADLAGLPDDFVAKLPKIGDLYKVGVDYPTYFPFMQNATNPDARRRLETAFDDRAAAKNLPIFKEALALRLKAARLLGYRSHAQFAIEPNMAKTPETVNAFLARLRARLTPGGREELEVLRAFKRAMEGRASDGVIHAWDWRYYDDLLHKAKYQVDEERVREYFPADLVVEQMLGVYQRMLGLHFRRIDHASVWHPDVKLYEITDASGGAPIGYFYMDLFPRPGKYSHAAAFSLITERRLADGSVRKPVSAIVANLDKPSADRPSLLDHEEVETIFHEFGHIMHQTLSKTKYGRFSGSNVARDFVEAPSQMLENWVWDPVVLQSLSGYYKDHSKKLPQDLLDKMIAAKNADVALVNLRQLLFGIVDMDYHSRRPPSDTTKQYARVMEAVSLIPMTPGTHPEASFGHLMGGYDAGYYGYLWSKVYAQDMFSVFKAKGLLNPEVGRRYRAEILERGSSRDEMDSLKAFLGRAPNEDAFLESIGLNAPK